MKNNQGSRAHLPRGAYDKPLTEVLSPIAGRDLSKPNWGNLRKNLCPKCGVDFMKGLIPNPFLLHHNCGFKISERKYQMIVSSQVNQQINDPEEEFDE